VSALVHEVANDAPRSIPGLKEEVCFSDEGAAVFLVPAAHLAAHYPNPVSPKLSSRYGLTSASPGKLCTVNK
jgi:hypothetical protein